jgi:glycosyltransferase involved in cell wall biosynthesis
MKENNDTIEVIIPFHRVDSYLEHAIKSILLSKFVKTRIIAVNDTGVNVDFKAIGLRQSDLLIRTTARGYVNALLKGVEASTEQFVAFLDSDDLMHPLRLIEQIEFLKKNELDIVSCSIERIDTNNKKLPNKRLLGGIPNPENRRELWLIGAHGADSTILCRGEVLRRYWNIHGTFSAHFADYGWALSLPQSIEIGHLEKEYYFYRSHPKQISKRPSLGNSWSTIYPLWESNLAIQFPEIWHKCSITDQVGLAIAFPAALVKLTKKEVRQLDIFIETVMTYFHERDEIEIRLWESTLIRRAFIADRGRSIRYWAQAPRLFADLVAHQISGYKSRRIVAR